MSVKNSSHMDDADEPSPPTCLVLRKLEESRYRIPGHGKIVCRLWRMEASSANCPSVYAVEMKGMGYSRMYTVGEDTAHAKRVYNLLVRHTVTPCALCDVLEELHGQ